MAIFDNETLLSENQVITATARSQDVIDLGPINQGIVRDIGKGKLVPLEIVVTEDFTAAGAATLTVALQTDDNAAFSSAKTILTTAAIPVADLKRGYRIPIMGFPVGTNERFVSVNYTVGSGPFTAGKIWAGVRLSDGGQGI